MTCDCVWLGETLELSKNEHSPWKQIAGCIIVLGLMYQNWTHCSCRKGSIGVSCMPLSSSRKHSISELQSYLSFLFKVANVNILTESDDMNVNKRSLRDKLQRGREVIGDLRTWDLIVPS